MNTLASVWRRKPPGHQPEVNVFELPQEKDLISDNFIKKYDKVQGQLEAIAAVDDLL